jgi:hypothetical protein
MMLRETRIALENYDRLLRRRRGSNDVVLAWDSNTLVYGDGGCSIEELCDPRFQGVTDADIGLEPEEP